MAVVVPVGRVRDVAAGVTDSRRDDARPLAEEILHAPEAAAGQDRGLAQFTHDDPPIRLLVVGPCRIHEVLRGDYPNVNAYASTPGSRNVISSVRSSIRPGCRTSWQRPPSRRMPLPSSSTSTPWD